MTFTYTSDGLAEIAAGIPARAKAAGIFFLPGARFEGENHVAISGDELPASEVINVAGQLGASFISVSATPLNLHGLVAELAGDEDDLPEAAQRIIRKAESHNGSVQGVSITWAAQGLAYVWHAQTPWMDKFIDDLACAQETAEAEEEAAREERMDEYRAQYQKAITAVLESPMFRGEQVGKRRILIPRILEEAGLEDISDSFVTSTVLRDANRIIAEKVYEFEEDFRTRKTELAAELQLDPVWMRETTKAKRKAAAMKFLTKKADGYRLTNSDLAGEISEIASVPRNWVTIKPNLSQLTES